MNNEEVINRLNNPQMTLAASVLVNMIEEKGKIYDDNYIISIVSIIIPQAEDISVNPLSFTVNNMRVAFDGESFKV